MNSKSNLTLKSKVNSRKLWQMFPNSNPRLSVKWPKLVLLTLLPLEVKLPNAPLLPKNKQTLNQRRKKARTLKTLTVPQLKAHLLLTPLKLLMYPKRTVMPLSIPTRIKNLLTSCLSRQSKRLTMQWRCSSLTIAPSTITQHHQVPLPPPQKMLLLVLLINPAILLKVHWPRLVRFLSFLLRSKLAD